ncbi:TlyA family RNA methyltransferase [Baaleninema sp.]|uniref:TlyA family RNA methyltransferase n=1 Tax=Baaleninema sp. TaxID=3101197 RepID=UPI003CFF108B
MPKKRLDSLLVDRNLCPSRQLAQRWIRAGEVRVNQHPIDKPGTQVSEDAEITVKARSKFVSRGGEKLECALQVFPVEVRDRICLDGGISTGGFTDCLLQAGAKRVYGVDVGYGQVDWKLRNDDRVILKERTNLRYLTPDKLYQNDDPHPDLGVVDVSFISLAKVFPAMWNLMVSPREAIVLVKPQFEVGRSKVGKKGVVRDPKARAEAIAQVRDAARSLGWIDRGLTQSTVRGPAGNIEYLMLLSEEGTPQLTDELIFNIAKEEK